jgi:dTDP-4-dehydrorhamnose reductase
MAAIFVTGANGQLGNELRHLSNRFCGYDFTFTDIDTLDITDPAAVKEAVRASSPGWVINCAAYNQVDKAESEPEAAMLINSTAVKNIAEALKGTDCKLIHVSTDYVYGGTSNTPCTEDTPADPRCAYAASKLSGERQALSFPATIVIRTSWLYSSYGHNFVKTILKHGSEKELLKVVFDQTGTPTHAADLAQAIMEIVSGVIRNRFAFKPGIYNYSNEGVCSWFDFATEIVKEAGLSCQILPVTSNQFIQAAKRPPYSVMDKTRIREDFDITIPHWRTSLTECIRQIHNHSASG